jgi:hypothetical protein
MFICFTFYKLVLHVNCYGRLYLNNSFFVVCSVLCGSLLSYFFLCVLCVSLVKIIIVTAQAISLCDNPLKFLWDGLSLAPSLYTSDKPLICSKSNSCSKISSIDSICPSCVINLWSEVALITAPFSNSYSNTSWRPRLCH